MRRSYIRISRDTIRGAARRDGFVYYIAWRSSSRPSRRKPRGRHAAHPFTRDRSFAIRPMSSFSLTCIPHTYTPQHSFDLCYKTEMDLWKKKRRKNRAQLSNLSESPRDKIGSERITVTMGVQVITSTINRVTA